MQTPEDNGSPEEKLPADETTTSSEEVPYEDSDLSPEPFTPKNVKHNFVPPGARPLTKPLTGETPSLSDCITMVRESTDVIRQVLDHNATLLERLVENETRLAGEYSEDTGIPDNAGNPHLRVLLGGINRTVAEEDQHTASIERGDALWSQTVDVDGKQISGGIPKQHLAENGRYSHQELLSYVTRKAGVGGTVDIPLWHSGLWLRFKAPSLVKLTVLFQSLGEIKNRIGTETRGLAFSNVSHFTKALVVDFALQYVINANVSYTTPSDLKPLIDTRDIPGLIVGFAGTLYPGGYPYASPCIADMSSCQHITTELLQVVNMWWVDTNALTAWQKRHMASRIDARAPHSVDTLKTYRAQHVYGNEELIRVGDLGFLIGSPDAYEHEALGAQWLNSLIDMSRDAFNEPPEGRNRRDFIDQLAESTAAREYTHWVRAVVEIDDNSPDGYAVLSRDKSFIAQILSDVYSADELVEEFNKKIETYIDRNLIAMTAIVSYNCPQCNTPAATKFKQRFDNLIPVDPMAEFFMLASRKLNRIRQ